MDVETERLERRTERSEKHKLHVDSSDEEASFGAQNDGSFEVKPSAASEDLTTSENNSTNRIPNMNSDEQVSHMSADEISGKWSEEKVPGESLDMMVAEELPDMKLEVTEPNLKSINELLDLKSPDEIQDITFKDKIPDMKLTDDIISSKDNIMSEENVPNRKVGDEIEDMKAVEKTSEETLKVIEDEVRSEDKIGDMRLEDEIQAKNAGEVNLESSSLRFEGVNEKTLEAVQLKLHEEIKGTSEIENDYDIKVNVTEKDVLSTSEHEEYSASSKDVVDEASEEHSDITEGHMTSAAEDKLDENKVCSHSQDDVKEPEEADHQAKCHLLHDEKQAIEVTSDHSGDKKDNDDEWVYVLGNDQLKKRVIKKGLPNSRPFRGQRLTIKCVGHLQDGTEIDKHESLNLTLGDDDFIHAFDLCLALMDKGETCEVFSASRFAYGDIGRAPDIPPNSDITYHIELIDYKDPIGFSTLSVAERVQLSNEKRERGNNLYSRNEFSRSIDIYDRALKVLDEEFESHGESPEELQQLVDTRIKCHNNMAAAQMKVGAWDAAAKSCDVVLKVQTDNVKALFRKGKCLSNMGEFSMAIPLLKHALKLEPQMKIIHQELSRLEKKNKAQTESEKALYQKMLGTDKETPVNKKMNGVSSESSVEPTKVLRSSKWLWYMAGGAGAAAILVSLGLTAYKHIHV